MAPAVATFKKPQENKGFAEFSEPAGPRINRSRRPGRGGLREVGGRRGSDDRIDARVELVEEGWPC